jgi:hypothetical protein
MTHFGSRAVGVSVAVALQNIGVSKLCSRTLRMLLNRSTNSVSCILSFK